MTKFTDIHPAPNGIPMAVHVSSTKIFVRFPFMHEGKITEGRREALKVLGFKWSSAYKHWYATRTKLVVREFVKKYPDTAGMFERFETVDPGTIEIKDYVPSDYLMNHQKNAALRALNTPRFGFFHDTGCGKTLESIEIFKQKGVRTLVVCPLSIIELAWLKDIEKFAPEIKACNLWQLLQNKSNVGRVRLRKAMEECDLFVVNFEMFRARNNFFNELDIKMLIIDESSRMKSNKSQITKNIIKFADNIDYCYLLSGTPAPNSPLEYWSQIRVIDPSLFGQSFYAFRNQYFYAYGFGNYLWAMKPSMEDTFRQKLATVSEVVRKEDVLDLPERTDNYRKVSLSKAERDAYEDMKNHLIAMVEGKEVVAANSAVKMLKLRQGTSGFFFDEDGNIVRTGTSKLNELMDLLEEIGNHQVIIWDHFHEEGDQIMKKLSKKAGRVDGTVTSQQTRIDTVNAFINGNLQYVVAHPGSLGHGVTLTNCSYAIYFSLSHSYELYVQSRDRIYRKGQKNACTYYHIVAANSVDNAIMQALKNKGDVVDAVLNYLKGEQ